MELLDNLILGFSVAGTLQNLMFCFIGALVGTLIGVLPGLITNFARMAAGSIVRTKPNFKAPLPNGCESRLS